jgi:hypothetical protein
LDIIDIYKTTRGQIEHVDNIISQRIIWLVISQSFFFSGYSILITGEPKDTLLFEKQHELILLFPIAAILMNVISLIDIISGMNYLKALCISFNDKKRIEKIDVPFPPIEGFRKLNLLKNLSALILPSVFAIIWIIILIRR